tara:strand:+ start:187 stop:1218 length:1032 start_codon:yes stop_codon:yes gene_type:complete
MSNMLEQAIVDAAALKEAALKNAETQILEKYAPEIKNAVDQLLNEAPEDEELGLMPEEEPDAESLEGPEEEVTDLDATPSYAEGEKLCPCPDEEEKIELDLDQLAAAVAAEEEAGGIGGGAQEPREDAMMALGEGEEEEEIDLTEEQLATILRELSEDVKVDVKPVPNGHPGDANGAEREEAEQQALAREVDTATAEENKKLRKVRKDLEERVKALSADKNTLSEEYKQLKSITLKMKDNLQESNLSNAKLVYTNRVLSSVSLNERQKTKIVEALSKSRTVEETKVIYETLQSTVGSLPTKRAPQSLSETISRKSTSLPRRKNKSSAGSGHAVDRMQKLAGIK